MIFYFRGWLNLEFSHPFLSTLLELLLGVETNIPSGRFKETNGFVDFVKESFFAMKEQLY